MNRMNQSRLKRIHKIQFKGKEFGNKMYKERNNKLLEIKNKTNLEIKNSKVMIPK